MTAASTTPLSILTPTSGGTLTDSAKAIWQLTPSGQLYRNAVVQTTGSATLALVEVASILWGLSALDLTWDHWTGSSWAKTPSAPSGLNTSDYALDPDLEYLMSQATPTEMALLISIQSLRSSPFSQAP